MNTIEVICISIIAIIIITGLFVFLFRCEHRYSTETRDGYQFCTKCGKAHKVPCNHNWKEWRTMADMNAPEGSIDHYIFKCSKCGETKKVYV